MDAMKICVLALLIVGCARHRATAPEQIYYYYQGRPGAATEYFGSLERANDAMHQSEAQCTYEMRQITMRQGFPPGPLVYDECMAAKGWVQGPPPQ